VSKKIEYPQLLHVAWVNWGSIDARGSADAATSVGARGSEGGPAASPLASKVSIALHMGQTRGPAFLLFKCAANLAVLVVSSTISPFLRTGDGRSLACGLSTRHPEIAKYQATRTPSAVRAFSAGPSLRAPGRRRSAHR